MKNYPTEEQLVTLIRKLDLHTQDNQQHVQPTTSTDGWVKVLEDRIIVQNPTTSGQYPTICPIQPLRLMKNGEEVFTETYVSSDDTLTWWIDEKPLFEIKITEDKLFAYFRLYAKKRYDWQFVTMEPRAQQLLRTVERADIVLEEVNLEQVITELERLGVQVHIDLLAIQRELEQPTYKQILVACGKAATPAKDAELEIFFSEDVDNQFVEIAGAVDYRNHLQIPSVQRGEVIAKKHPPIEGRPGVNIFGEMICPEIAKDLVIVAKPTVELLENGDIVANRGGRPRITGGTVKTFDISPTFTVSGDVNIKTGNIVFSGDVIVYGNVTDHMIVESLGNVYVYGNVYNARITATGSIIVRGNAIGSDLYSGYFGVLFNRLYNASKTLYDHVDGLLGAIGLLQNALEEKRQAYSYGQLVLLLIENKFREIPHVIKEILQLVSNIQKLRKEEYQQLRILSELFLTPRKIVDTVSKNLLQSYRTLLQNTHIEVARMQEVTAEIHLNQCHKSNLKSNGNIVIYREGIVLSELYSAGNIVMKKEDAVCRGAILEAEGSIAAKIIGGNTAAASLLRAKKDIFVQKIYSGRVCIGNYCLDIYDENEHPHYDIHYIKKRAFAARENVNA